MTERANYLSITMHAMALTNTHAINANHQITFTVTMLANFIVVLKINIIIIHSAYLFNTDLPDYRQSMPPGRTTHAKIVVYRID